MLLSRSSFSGTLSGITQAMTDYVITNGRASSYPTKHYGGHFTGARATFCTEADLTAPDANVQAIPTNPVTPLSSSPVVVGERFFGGHIKSRANDSQSEVSFGSIRSHDFTNGKSRWQYIEPSDNVWDFADLDSWVDTHFTAGRDLVFTLFGTPGWASARPNERNAYSDQVGEPYPYNRGITAEPLDMAKWDRFCSKVATRYLGKIKYYEVWNEPNYGSNGTSATSDINYFSGTFAKLAEMTRRAAQTIKAIDPTVKIVAPSITNWTTTVQTATTTAEGYFTNMLGTSDGAGGLMKDHVDIINVHLYVSGNHITSLPKMIDRVKAAMSTAGVAGKEVWDTESGPINPTVSSMTEDAARMFMARSLVVQAAKGISRTFFYQYDHPDMGIKDTVLATYQAQVRDLLTSGTISSTAMLDGEVYYMTIGGLNIL